MDNLLCQIVLPVSEKSSFKLISPYLFYFSPISEI